MGRERIAVFSAIVLCLAVISAMAACASFGATPTAAVRATPLSSATPTLAAAGPAVLATLAPKVSGLIPGKTATPLTPNATGIPPFTHIYLLVMENEEFDSVIGDSSAPYINGLTAQYALATKYTGVGHPSEPNYLALFSGSTQGVTDDGTYNLKGANLADQVEAAGKTWRVYAQNDKPGCFTGSQASGGEDGNGSYARKHNPAISFINISSSPSRCDNISDFAHFDPNAANFEMIIPNLCNDMHDCSVATGDKFLEEFIPKITSSQPWKDGGILFVVWDEGRSVQGGGGQVPLVVISSQVAKGYKSTVAHNHYSLVRTIEDAWGLPCLAKACQANNLAEFFR